MQTSNAMRLLSPGVLYSGTDAVDVQISDDSMHLKINPASHSDSTLFFILPKKIDIKKYTIEVNFEYPNATVQLFGLYQLSEKESVTIQTFMHHRVPHCKSEQVWKGVMDDQAKAAFEGNIIVYPNAQKTSAHLSNKNLLLSQAAEINTKPILEIEADDVQCTHGATVGCLDMNALFYLRSRGIAEVEARRLLIDAFIHEITDAVTDEGFRRQMGIPYVI